MAMSKPLAFLAVMAPKKGLKEHEIQFLAEANVTPRNVARFGHAGRQRLSGVPLCREIAPRIRPGLRARNAFGLARKFVVDIFVAPVWPRLKKALDGLGNTPVKYVIDTHWHFDHTDNNAHPHAAGATVLAHENTKKRMTEPHLLPVLYRGPNGALVDVHVDPSPVEALPQQTFRASYKLQANGETIALQHFATAAHTDGDIYVHFEKADVIQMGDPFFNGIYPYIDPGTGGTITGTIAAVDKILTLAGDDTKIVPGHGPLGNKADLTKFRDMLVTSRDRIKKLKSAGKSAQEAVAEKPFADLDPVWGKGVVNGDQWVYLAL